jgi:four helix bundle protein
MGLMPKPWDLRERTIEFAVLTYRFCRTVPNTTEGRDIMRQLRRATSSVAANCRAMRRTQSDKAFAAKAAMIIEEADEAGFWFEFLVRTDLARKEAVAELLLESNELVAIFTASRKTVTARLEKQRRSSRSGAKKARNVEPSSETGR